MYNIKYDFSAITNQTEAYILGFIYADGYVIGAPSHRLGITLAYKDKELLQQISSYISDDILLKEHTNNNFKNINFILCRKQIIENLNKLGVVSNKTHVDFGLPKISEDFVFHFIRGFFDGDGSIIKDRNSLCFYICSPLPKILEDIKLIFDKNQISSRITKSDRKGTFSNISKNPATYDQYRLIITKNIYLQKLYNLLYKDDVISLKRKKTIFYDCFKYHTRISRNLQYLTYHNEVKSLKEWSKYLNISKATLAHRIFISNWTIDDALSYKIRENKNPQKNSIKRGQLHPNCKFLEQDIIDIFISKESNKVLATKYNVHRDTIYKIKVGINCSSVTNNIIKNL